MLTPKFRLFAGPNASGKTYVFKKIRKFYFNSYVR